MSPARIALLTTLLAAVPLHLPAQQPPNSSPAATQPSATPANNSNRSIATLRATARLVVLDVVVTDGNGNPVQGLKPSDFTLSEDGVPQNFASFSEHQASDSNTAATQPSLPPNTFTVQPPLTEEGTETVIVLDNLHYPNYPLVRNDVLAFMKTVAPGNPIAILRMDWRGMHLVQGFTTDPQRLQDAVASNRWLPPIPPFTSPFTHPPCILPYKGVINPYQRLARYLSAVPGRINLAWVTDEGMPDRFRGNDYPDLTNMVRNLNGSTNVLRLSRVVPYAIKAGGYIGGILQPLPVPDIPLPVIIADSHADPFPTDCPLFPAAQGGLLSNQAMADIAAAAGGHAFFDGADKALAQVMALGSNYYTLSYVPTNTNWNGAFRKIAINVSGIKETGQSRFGWSAYSQPNVVYRNGYYARTKPDPASVSGSTTFGMETTASPVSQPVAASSPGIAPIAASSPNIIPHIPSPMEAAMGFGTLTPNQVDFTIVVTPSLQIEKPKSAPPSAKDNFLADSFHNAPYRNYKVHYWIDPKGLKFSRIANGSYRDDLQFVAIIYRDDGFVANSVSITAHIQASANDLENLMATGVTFDQTIAMPIADNAMAENYFLRAGVSETSTGHIGALELPADWIKLPPQPAANNAATNPAPPTAPSQ
ncbi:MAG TPA: VWA domain-containing protein [Acidobacteriaceae bacterium]|jgi:VWFA-related protein|nr:VWA domain-containing protein [Acidobacteriaceae bacterium]